MNLPSPSVSPIDLCPSILGKRARSPTLGESPDILQPPKRARDRSPSPKPRPRRRPQLSGQASVALDRFLNRQPNHHSIPLIHSAFLPIVPKERDVSNDGSKNECDKDAGAHEGSPQESNNRLLLPVEPCADVGSPQESNEPSADVESNSLTTHKRSPQESNKLRIPPTRRRRQTKVNFNHYLISKATQKDKRERIAHFKHTRHQALQPASSMQNIAPGSADRHEPPTHHPEYLHFDVGFDAGSEEDNKEGSDGSFSHEDIEQFDHHQDSCRSTPVMRGSLPVASRSEDDNDNGPAVSSDDESTKNENRSNSNDPDINSQPARRTSRHRPQKFDFPSYLRSKASQQAKRQQVAYFKSRHPGDRLHTTHDASYGLLPDHQEKSCPDAGAENEDEELNGNISQHEAIGYRNDNGPAVSSDDESTKNENRSNSNDPDINPQPARRTSRHRPQKFDFPSYLRSKASQQAKRQQVAYFKSRHPGDRLHTTHDASYGLLPDHQEKSCLDAGAENEDEELNGNISQHEAIGYRNDNGPAVSSDDESTKNENRSNSNDPDINPQPARRTSRHRPQKFDFPSYLRSKASQQAKRQQVAHFKSRHPGDRLHTTHDASYGLLPDNSRLDAGAENEDEELNGNISQHEAIGYSNDNGPSHNLQDRHPLWTNLNFPAQFQTRQLPSKHQQPAGREIVSKVGDFNKGQGQSPLVAYDSDDSDLLCGGYMGVWKDHSENTAGSTLEHQQCAVAIDDGDGVMVQEESENVATVNFGNAMDVDDEEGDKYVYEGGEYTYAPDIIQKRDSWHSMYKQLKAKPDMPVNGAAMAVFMEMTAEAQWEGRNRNAKLTPSSRSGGSKETIVRVLNVRRDPLENELKSDVRAFARALLKFPAPLQVPSPEQLDLFKRTKDERDGPMIDNLQLDLGGIGVSSFWNKHASHLFASEFISQDVYTCTDHAAIATTFMVHLQTLQSLYRKQQRLQEDDIDDATQIMIYDKKREKARESRRRYLFKRRKDALKPYSVVPRMREFLDTIWTKLHPDAMSGDESDVQNGECRYVVPVLEWRDPNVLEWLRIHDHLYLSTRFTTDDRPTPGRFPHLRTYSNRVQAGRRPVTGLPANFYNSAWLASLTNLERHMLNIQPAIDLNYPPEILKIAARFQGVKNRDTPPLSRNHPSLDAYEKSASSLQLPTRGAFRPPAPQQIRGLSQKHSQSQPIAGPSKRR